MGTENPILNDVFFAAVHQRITAAPHIKWVSTFAFECTALFSSRGDLTIAATSAADFVRALLLSSNEVERIVVSAAVELPNLPTTPDDFYIIDYGGAGLRSSGSAAERCDLDVCMHIRRNVTTGHWGHLYLRGCLLETNIQAPSGVLSYTDPTAQNTQVLAAMVDSGLDQYASDTESSTGLNLITYKPGSNLPPANAVVKFVHSMTSVGVTRRKFNKKYYDRGLF